MVEYESSDAAKKASELQAKVQMRRRGERGEKGGKGERTEISKACTHALTWACVSVCVCVCECVCVSEGVGE